MRNGKVGNELWDEEGMTTITTIANNSTEYRPVGFGIPEPDDPSYLHAVKGSIHYGAGDSAQLGRDNIVPTIANPPNYIARPIGNLAGLMTSDAR